MKRPDLHVVLLLVLAVPHVCPAHGFHVVGTDPGPWKPLLEASGFPEAPLRSATLAVIPAGDDAAATDWPSFVRRGGYLLLEGTSGIAESFGFHSNGDHVRATREQYRHDPALLVVWETPLDIPVCEVPESATVFSRDRWTGAPLMAGVRLGAGAVLWIASGPGPRGYDRMPYLVRSLQELGLTAPLASKRLWAFFDYGYRTRVNVDYLARRWRAMGIAGLYVSAWHFQERDAERDAYLAALIQACHRNAILAYAWLELPHVSDQFWYDRPGCREKTALLQDAAIYWRKNMNLVNPECAQAAAAGIREMLDGFDWDGANLSELYFEGPSGILDLPELTPFNDDVRREVKALYGFDPVDLFNEASPSYYQKNPQQLRNFYDYRVDLQQRLHVDWIRWLLSFRSGSKPSFAVTVTYIDDLFDSRFHDNVGADTSRTLKLLDRFDFEFMGEDPSAIWQLGPERYIEMSKLYAAITPLRERLAVDINIVSRPLLAFPTKIQTGSEVSKLVHIASASFKTVALYSEVSILPADWGILPGAAAIIDSFAEEGGRMTVKSEYGVGVQFPSAASVDGSLYPFSDSYVWLPAGEHRVEEAHGTPHTRLLDFNGDLKRVRLFDAGLQLQYESDARAIAVVDRRPQGFRLDAEAAEFPVLEYKGRYSILLPLGAHSVEVITQE